MGYRQIITLTFFMDRSIPLPVTMSKKIIVTVLLAAFFLSGFYWWQKLPNRDSGKNAMLAYRIDSAMKYANQEIVITDTSVVKRKLLKKGIYFGCYISENDAHLVPPRPANYLTEIDKYFNFYSIPAWFYHIESKGRGQYDFTKTDKVADFAVSHGAKMQAHNMIWNSWIPEWITKGNYTPDELADILKKHIQTVVRHYHDKYPGSLIAWDIVNEAMSDSENLDPKKAYPNGLRKDLPIWNVIHKPGSTDPTDYIQLAFQWAHEADPNVKLYWNEYNVEFKGFKMDRWFKLIKELRAKGVPIDGAGFQNHMSVIYPHPLDELRENMDRLAAIGVESQVTEMDVLMSNTSISFAPYYPTYMHSEIANSPSVADFEKQAQLYKGVIEACINAKKCKALILFGAWDPVTFANFDFKRNGKTLGPFYPNILDDKMKPKLAYKALVDVVNAKIK